MKNLKLLILFYYLPTFLLAQVDFRNQYSASNIPLEMLKNANAVVRAYNLSFKVINNGEAIEEEHKVVTILNDKAEDYDEPIFYYGGISELDDIEALIYDSAGKQVKKMKKKDIEDFKPYEVYVNDARFKRIKFPRLAYPYTVEYTVKTKHNGLLHYPIFQPQTKTSESVINATFSLKMPNDLKVRTKEINIPNASKINDLEWNFKNIKAFKEESFIPSNVFPFPMILSAPTHFKLGKYEGNMESWKDFGLFLNQLNQGRNTVSPELLAKLKTATADCKDDYCKIQKVYEIMQNSTRYFYVGLGIGGWQPAPASDVDNFKYGDCKGLSNYMVSMLNAIGLPARYVLIRGGEDNQIQYPDFPNAHFNHAIACVPMEKDTVWLECTSQTESCGFLSDFTDNRPALIVTPQGGKLVKTPKYDEKINVIAKKTSIKLEKNGNATLSSIDTYTGVKGSLPAQVAGYNEEIRKKYLYQTLNLNDFELKSLTFERKKSKFPSVVQSIELDIPSLASASGKRLFLPINILSKWTSIPVQDSVRRFGVQADARGFTENDQVSIELPQGFKPENNPVPIAVQSLFGTYEMSVKADIGKLLISRKLIINNSIQPKEKFAEWTDFCKAINRADKLKIVLVSE